MKEFLVTFESPLLKLFYAGEAICEVLEELFVVLFTFFWTELFPDLGFKYWEAEFLY